MRLNLPHADPDADPHDAIAAQLRDLAPRITDDIDDVSIAPTASQESLREPSFHSAPLNDNAGRPSAGSERGRSYRSILLITVGVGIAAAVTWHVYGGTAKQHFSEVMPQLVPAAMIPAQTTSVEPQNTATQAAEQKASLDPSPAHGGTATPLGTDTASPAAATAPLQAMIPPDVAQSIEAMTHEIAALRQTVEQLQVNQQQLSRDLAKINEQEARRKFAQTAKSAPRPQTPPQRAVTPPMVSPRATAPYPPQASSQTQGYSQGAAQRDAYIAPPAPTQLPPQPGDTSVPRPPLPLR